MHNKAQLMNSENNRLIVLLGYNNLVVYNHCSRLLG
jgi:hypothetical protein